MSSRILLVDFANTLHRSLHTISNLSHRGEYTGGLYGVVAQIAAVVNAYGCDKVLVCMDSPPYLRKRDFPGYKGNRKKKDAVFLKRLVDSTQLCTEFFIAADIATWAVPGYECDDLIVSAALEWQEENRVIIRSNDSDMFQLMDSSRILIVRGTKDTPVMDKEVFATTYSIPARMWPWVSALAGSHNAVPGLAGVGLKTALKIVRSEQQLAAWRKRYPVIDEYYRLCQLPYNDALPNPPTMRSMHVRRAERWLLKKGIQIAPNIGKAFDALR